MKKFLFSPWLKAVAVILFLASLTLGGLVGIQAGQQFWEEDNYIYDFGSSLEDSWYFRYLVSLSEDAVLGTLREIDYRDPTYVADDYDHSSMDGQMETAMPPTVGMEDELSPTEVTEEWDYIVSPSVSSLPRELTEEELALFLRRSKERLETLPYLDYIEYYVNLNGTIISNTDFVDAAPLMNGVYKYYAIESDHSTRFSSSHPSYWEPSVYDYGIEHLHLPPMVIATRIRPEYVKSCALLWDKQEDILYTAGSRMLVCILTLLLSLIYLICVCGKDKDGNRKEIWVDKIWVEFHLGAMAAIGIGAVMLCWVVIETAFDKQFPIETAYLIPGLLIPLAGGLILCSLLSILRNLKAGAFAKRCGVCIIVKFLLGLLKKLLIALWKCCKAMGRGIKRWVRSFASARESTFTLLQIGALLLYTVVAVIVGVIGAEGGPGILLFLLPFYGFGAYLIVRKGKDLEEIKKGASRIRSGDLTHQVPDSQSTYFRNLTEDINHIAKGLDASLCARMKAERMKTELITNVSHDLKTPLTSIITYTELLSKVEALPEEAEDYIRIIGDKSQRLKSLTQDLFDMSRVQSGNEEVCWEVLDAAILLEQSLAEETAQIPEDALRFCLKTQENLTFMGDGRKLTRVLGNLLQNVIKYALPGTRVFLSAFEEEGQVVMECKNTSAYPLDFAPEDILGRFVRGDSARSTEGNGLGLPIAKSYTELCGGTFCLTLDGDLFKVRLSFPKSK